MIATHDAVVGTVAGPVVGLIAGTVVGPVSGIVVGSIAGTAAGPATGLVAGSVVGPVAGSIAKPVAGSACMLHSASAHGWATGVSGRRIVAGAGAGTPAPDTTAGCRRTNQRRAGGDPPARTGEPSDR